MCAGSAKFPDLDRILAELQRHAAHDGRLVRRGRTGGGFVRLARRNGARTIYVGPEEPANNGYFDDVVLAKAGEALPEMMKEMVE